MTSARTKPNETEEITENRQKILQEILHEGSITLPARRAARHYVAVGDEDGTDGDVEERLPLREVVVVEIPGFNRLVVQETDVLVFAEI